MTRFIVEPEVAGHLGPRTILDRTVHPPKVSVLEYVFDGWLGDPLLESFPCFILRKDVFETLINSGQTGFSMADVYVAISPEFEQCQEENQLPEFCWLMIHGDVGSDFSLLEDGRLVVSSRALEELRSAGMVNAEVTPLG